MLQIPREFGDNVKAPQGRLLASSPAAQRKPGGDAFKKGGVANIFLVVLPAHLVISFALVAALFIPAAQPEPSAGRTEEHAIEHFGFEKWTELR